MYQKIKDMITTVRELDKINLKKDNMELKKQNIEKDERIISLEKKNIELEEKLLNNKLKIAYTYTPKNLGYPKK